MIGEINIQQTENNKGMFRNPYLMFLPFLFIYLVFVFIFQHDSLMGDEDRFLLFATNITHGHYATQDVTLGNGPGYSVFLAPFVALGIPLIVVKLLNAVFLYLSVVLLYKSLRFVTTFRIALIVSLFWGCYYNSFEYLHLMYSEIFASFLVAWLAYLLIIAFHTTNPKFVNKQVILAGFVFGYLILTKVIFSYVLVFMLAVSAILWLLNRKAVNHRRGIIILAIAFLTITPYLAYTYHVTGKFFYWSTTAGENLYWMSSHHEGEYGSWFASPNRGSSYVSSADSTKQVHASGYLNFLDMDNLIPGIGDSIVSRHQKDFDEIVKYSTTGVERDEAFKRIAIRNIKANPSNYVKNCLSNVGRMLFNYPYSYSTQRPSTLLRFPLNGIIVIFMLFSIVPTLINWRRISYSIRFMLFITLLYLGGSILGTAEIRMFSIIVPILLFWIAAVLTKTVKIKLKVRE